MESELKFYHHSAKMWLSILDRSKLILTKIMEYKILLAILLSVLIALLVMFYYDKLNYDDELLFLDALQQQQQEQKRQEQQKEDGGLCRSEPVRFKIDTFWNAQEKHGMELCPEKSPGLNGTIPVDFGKTTYEEIEQEYPQLKMGGYWKPPNCTARHRVAVIIPYRNREEHLRGFLHHIHGFLQRQQLEYAVFVVEQADRLTFNRGKLLNIGFVEALRFYNWQCFVFHDIDALPENDMNMYSCPEKSSIVKHMVHGFKKDEYKLLYAGWFSAAIIFTEEAYRKANGYSNDYWGWGGEDDDLRTRVRLSGLEVHQSSQEFGRYAQFPHDRDKNNEENPCRFKLLQHTEQKKPTDGLSSLKYRLLSISLNRLYTLIQVDVMQEQFNDWKNYTKTTMGC